MTYHERIQRYIEGKLSEEERKELEQEIEKQEAIADYLYEQSEIPELKSALYPHDENEEKDSAEKENVKKERPGGKKYFGHGKKESTDDKVTEMINRSIRRAFRNLGLAVLAVTLTVVLFLQFCLPQIVSAFYYDPGKESESGSNQMSLDMAVYTELMFPEKMRDSVQVVDKGYGRYDILINQTISYTRNFTHVSGEVNKGELKLYDVNALQPPVGNCYVWTRVENGNDEIRLSDVMKEQKNLCAAGTRAQAEETLANLDEDKMYIGYVSLDRLMSYEELQEFLNSQESGDVWCAVKTREWEDGIFHADNLGFVCSDSSSEETHREHFVSMLNYMADQEAFLDMMKLSKMTFQSAAEYVEENGIKIYGFAAAMKPETALKLMEEDEVYEIYMEELR